MADKKRKEDLPQPRTYGPLMNLPQLDSDAPVQSFVKLAETYGPIFRMELPGRDTIYISSQKLVKEVCDEDRFDKNVWPPLQKARQFAGDGLFTSWTEEENWKKAHNILLPSFSQRAMQQYHDKMVDISLQLIQKWSRLNDDDPINVPEDMTRLTLDTIGLCGFNYRFNSFYTEKNHPFVHSMVEALDEAMSQLQRIDIQQKLSIQKKKEFNKHIDTMYELVDKLIEDRREADVQDKGDLLSRMLEGKDPQTGEKLDDENIRYQMITFLIAGHETTSGLLSFAIYYLMKNPEKLKKAQQEAETVLMDEFPSYQQVRELKYVRMVLEETLRLWPTAPAFSLYAREDTTLADEYIINKGDSINVLLPKLHRDKEAWGENVEEFVPERFEDPSKVPENAYKPFGNGQRACIGQQFALHEATLVLGMILKEFDFINYADYELEVKETLTLKPHEFTMKVAPRREKEIKVPGQEKTVAEEKNEDLDAIASKNHHGTPLLVLYGSQAGTAEGVARELAEMGELQGFETEVSTLNGYKGSLPEKGMVLLVSASYNGKPTDNGEEFLSWLKETNDSLQGVKYAVFGCGDTNWASTYQKVPKELDKYLEKKGAHRLHERGEGNASGDFEMDFNEWQEELWALVLEEFDVDLEEDVMDQKNNMNIEFVTGIAENAVAKTHLAKETEVLENRELQSEESERFTRHLEIAVPPGLTYEEGDHIAIIPQNDKELVARALKRFDLNGNDKIEIEAQGRSAAHLPIGKPVSIFDVFSYSVELQEPATRKQLEEMAEATTCPPHKKELEELMEEGRYKEEIQDKNISMLALLEKYEACELEFTRFLALLPALKPRYYSISSSPKKQPEKVSITVSVVRGKAISGEGEYRGTASNFLMNLKAGDDIVIFFRMQRSFRLPENPEKPVVMVGPGTGVAPFRGFLQARDELKKKEQKLGEAHLYFGSRHEEQDYLYDKELREYEETDVVKLHTAFSRMENQPKTYVQDLMKENKEELIELLEEKKGHFYICGEGSKMAPQVEKTLKDSYCEFKGKSEDEAQEWLDTLQEEGRFAKDVW